MDYQKLIDLSTKISLATVLILILVGGWQGVWVFGPTYREAIAERNEWKALALKGARLSEAGLPHVVSTMVPPAPLAPTDLENTAARLRRVENLQSSR